MDTVLAEEVVDTVPAEEAVAVRTALEEEAVASQLAAAVGSNKQYKPALALLNVGQVSQISMPQF